MADTNTNTNTKTDEVYSKTYTRDDLINIINNFIASLSDEAIEKIDPDAINSLKDLNDGIMQAYDRIKTLNSTVEDLQTIRESLNAQINKYLADQINRSKSQMAEQEDEDNVNPADKALDIVEERSE